VKATGLYHKLGINNATFYNWKAQYRGTTVSEAARLRTLEEENGRLKKLRPSRCPTCRSPGFHARRFIRSRFCAVIAVEPRSGARRIGDGFGISCDA
jgi:hypothetical protein